MKKILIIEDEIELLDGISEILQFEGFDVVQANNGLDGIELAINSNPDLILSDIMMPGIDGFEVLKRLRKHSKTVKTPIILITALSERVNIRIGMELGANDYLIKPFTREDLLRMISGQVETRTDENKTKSIKEKDEKLDYNLSYDFRTPLNVILGFGNLLMNDPEEYPKEVLMQMGESIYSEGINLFGTIKKYLVLIDLEINKAPCQVSKVERIDNHIKELITAVALKYNRVNDLNLSLEMSHGHIKIEWFDIVISELAKNALQYSQQGKNIKFESKINNELIEFSITDEGIGYSEESIDEINRFESFIINSIQKQEIFGILLCKRIILSHKGSFFVSNNSVDGATISFSIPYAKT